MVPVTNLEEYGFSAKFVQLIHDGFPNAGNYVGDKSAIGLNT